MKRTSLVISAALLAGLSAGTGWAETDPASDIAEQRQTEEAARAERESRLQTLMEQMTEEMQAIRGTSDEEARSQLMNAHRRSMHETMSLMRQMGGMHMRELVAQHAGRAGDTEGAAEVSRHRHKRPPVSHSRASLSDAERLADLETRVDMMQIMMESMMEAWTH